MANTSDPTPNPAPIPLDPKSGGQCVDYNALEVGDIIVSTTFSKSSQFIKFMTGAEVSHAAIYVGNNMVVESLENGVATKPLPVALIDDSLAVAYRVPGLTGQQAETARDFALLQHGRYSYTDAAAAGATRLARGFGEITRQIQSHGGYGAGKIGAYTPEQTRPQPPAQAAAACPVPPAAQPAAVSPYLCAKAGICQPAPVEQARFFCSHLVFAAFEHAGVPLTTVQASRLTPADVTDLWLQKKLSYVGHLKTPDQRE